jgi:periplasmic divalent cation tolerance protein
VALTTAGSDADAERLARALVERRLAACVNVVPRVVSHYRWKGALQRDEERLLVVKTRAERVGALRAALVELHPYELPELVVLQVAAGHAPYLAWLDECVLGGAAPHPPGPPAPLGGVNPTSLRSPMPRAAAARGRRAPARGRPRGRRRPRSRR